MGTRTEQRVGRRIGDVGRPDGGPLLVAVGGVHGNEPAGVLALERAFATIAERSVRVRGRFIGLAGNVGALNQGLRYQDLDLNRAFTPERVEALSRPLLRPPEDAVSAEASLDPRPPAEDEEQRELMRELSDAFSAHEGPVYCIDLHTTSGAGAPFATLGDTLRNRDFALRFPVIKLLGIEEQIDGALLEWVNRLGHITLGFEAGQHDDPGSIDRHEAFVWQALEHAGLIDAADVPDRDLHRARLEQASRGRPQFIEIRVRHPVQSNDGFRMEPGWSHFQPVSQGTLLARDDRGPIVASESGYLMMPLYQGQGSDGFFIARPVRPLWLRVSRLLRSLGVPRLAHWLPGVRRKPGDPSTLIVNRDVARLRTREIFHLLGFRRVRENGAVLEVSRRR